VRKTGITSGSLFRRDEGWWREELLLLDFLTYRIQSKPLRCVYELDCDWPADLEWIEKKVFVCRVLWGCHKTLSFPQYPADHYQRLDFATIPNELADRKKNY
jgi:hypothetical protein